MYKYTEEEIAELVKHNESLEYYLEDMSRENNCLHEYNHYLLEKIEKLEQELKNEKSI